jgi:hypothetical protein
MSPGPRWRSTAERRCSGLSHALREGGAAVDDGFECLLGGFTIGPIAVVENLVDCGDVFHRYAGALGVVAVVEAIVCLSNARVLLGFQGGSAVKVILIRII